MRSSSPAFLNDFPQFIRGLHEPQEPPYSGADIPVPRSPGSFVTTSTRAVSTTAAGSAMPHGQSPCRSSAASMRGGYRAGQARRPWCRSARPSDGIGYAIRRRRCDPAGPAPAASVGWVKQRDTHRFYFVGYRCAQPNLRLNLSDDVPHASPRRD